MVTRDLYLDFQTWIGYEDVKSHPIPTRSSKAAVSAATTGRTRRDQDRIDEISLL